MQNKSKIQIQNINYVFLSSSYYHTSQLEILFQIQKLSQKGKAFERHSSPKY